MLVGTWVARGVATGGGYGNLGLGGDGGGSGDLGLGC